MRLVVSAMASAAFLILAACGGGKGSLTSGGGGNKIAGPAANVATAIVDAGPSVLSESALNTLFTSVQVCVPGSSSSCQTIDNIEIDTGSSGLRIIASALTIALPIATDSGGNSLGECTQFVTTYSWGPVALADLTISGETASSVPVQVIGDSNFASVPAGCSGLGLTEQDTVQSFGANGILGVGTTVQDCGVACETSAANPALYYSCPSASNCVVANVAVANQIPNPVTMFATDNNGVIIELPSVSANGAATATGAIVFGIDTQSNNASGTTATVIPVQVSTGYFGATLSGTIYCYSFLDTGSNGFFFNDTALTQCTDITDFYCPATTQSLAATVYPLGTVDSATSCSQSSPSAAVNFQIANADTLFNTDTTGTAFDNVGGTYGTDGTIDFGLPFFYGRNVYEVFETKSSSAGSGPYVAF